MLTEIVPIILCRNEEANIGRALEALSWAGRVVVLDSGSTDATRAVALEHANVDWHERQFDNHANQSNHALALASASPWVLFMDCDYIVTAAAREELAALRPSEHIVGYWSRFRYQLRGRLLRGALYPRGSAFSGLVPAATTRRDIHKCSISWVRSANWQRL